ncbi:MAG: D-glycero-beta-D-manno-heptose 1-phosphate adenylyltransferase [Candidatus Micrarchaeota archaeon]|nr:D-glycero-beta-D-manno-heptose 1-phosphate adenylyltransferase [Candidatus Micrarchaeota archaeon]
MKRKGEKRKKIKRENTETDFFDGKLVSLNAITKILKKDLGTVVFTNGCFDILHAGHVDYLKKAKMLGDILIVGLNSDKSIKLIKGKNRPINNQRCRAKVLSAISYVDYIILFDEENAAKLLKKIKPNIYVKGSDWKNKKLPEAEIVKSYGGRVVLIDVVERISTTKIIQDILNKMFGEKLSMG